MPSKTCALDIMPTARLKEVLGTILPSLTHIVNRSLDQGTFYTNWKEELVKPLVKKRSLGTTMTNYRSVSNLQFISKIVEKVTLDQFTQHCNSNSLLSGYQSAHIKYYSCETSLVKLINDILWAMEKQLVTVVVILDLSAAFDTVDLQTAFYWFPPCRDLLPVSLFCIQFPGFLVPRCVLLFWGIFVRGLRFETFVRVLHSSELSLNNCK